MTGLDILSLSCDTLVLCSFEPPPPDISGGRLPAVRRPPSGSEAVARNEVGVREISARAEEHEHLPHIVKFSGGRSSAALAFLLAESGLLRPERGDAILFANTSAEHPATYEFARECKRSLEHDFGIPFFWFEFCTVEDASRGVYVRRPSYRLVLPEAVEDDPRGFRSRGEVFEEMLSYQGMLPNPHSRSCTAKLKLYPSHQLLAEWLGVTDGPAHAGHWGRRRFVTPDTALVQYRRNRGAASDDVYRERVRCMTNRPHARSAQRWGEYTEAPVLAFGERIRAADRPAGPAPMWGPAAAGHVTLLGLRADEQKRIDKIESRSVFAEGASTSCSIHTQPPGEHPIFPLAEWGIDATDVRRFWLGRDFDLRIPEHAGNCVFCFMKGTRSLAAAAARPDPDREAGAPSDIAWWSRMEERYRRQVAARDGDGTSSFGFFGLSGPTFAEIAAGAAPDLGRYAVGTPACDCTD